jgi:hypothetical protein
MSKYQDEIVVVVDKSGSMASISEAAIKGVNSFVDEQKEIDRSAEITIVFFSSGQTGRGNAWGNHQKNEWYEIFYKGDIKSTPVLSNETYVPDGGTALYDALGDTIDNIGSKIADMAENDRPENVIFSILTDGYENASHKFNQEQVFAKIRHQEDKYNWNFVYLGANQDALAVGHSLGIHKGESVAFASTVEGTADAYRGMSKKTTSYRV